MTALVITQRDDPTADHVIDELNNRGSSVIRLDMADFPDDAGLTARFTGSSWTGRLLVGNRATTLQEITGVYYRRPTAPHVRGGGSPDERAFLEAEIKLGAGGILATLPEDLWLGHPRRLDAVKASKPWQLAMAASCGLSVPQTMVTGSARDAADFAAQVGNVAVKPFGISALYKDGETDLIFARRLQAGEIRASDLCGIPHQVQQWIDAAYAVRMAMVDNEIFAARIQLGSPAAHVDWRSDYDALTYERIDPPEPVARSIRSLMRKLQLRYSAHDFLVDEAGVWWYLETNANGQWAWIPEVTGEITAAIATALTDPVILPDGVERLGA